MDGPRAGAVRAVAALGVALAGCADPPRGLGWDVRFSPVSLADRAEVVEAQIREGGCAGAAIVFHAEVTRGGLARMSPPDLQPGIYGFRARARDASCTWFASGCTEVALPTGEPRVLVTVTPAADPEVGCGDAGVADAGVADAPGDAPAADGGTDAGPRGDVVGIGGGAAHACALRESGEVLCWGRNAEGQLGDGTTTGRATAAPVAGLPPAAALSHGSTALHSCAVLRDGTAMCWGRNANGQLGDGTNNARPTPVAVESVATATAIAAGGEHTCFLRADGQILCCGSGGGGQLGRLAGLRDRTPAPVTGLAGATRVTAGQEHTCALDGDGQAWCWGQNMRGQSAGTSAGDRVILPQRVEGVTASMEIAAGSEHTCAVLTDGGLICWGQNEAGQLGTGGPMTMRNDPMVVTGLTGAGAIAGGGFQDSTMPYDPAHTCAIAAGAVRCWGDNASGQLGDGTITSRPTPGPPVVLPAPPQQIVLGARFGCALIAREVWCWGDGDHGQLGDGSMTDSTAPVRVALP